jgi:hypothetical protein
VAPAFGLTLRFARRERLLLAAWCGVSMAALAAWLAAHAWVHWGDGPLPSLWQAAVAAIVAAPAALLGWRVLPAAAWELHWDAGNWRLRSPGHDGANDLPGEAEPMLDLGVWMLLRFRGEDSSRRWLVADADRAGRHWSALRAALYLPKAPAASPAPSGPGR